MTDRSERGRKAYAAGLDAEETATRMAVQRGLTVLERRYRTPHGEIDLIAAADNAIVFVEVKARRTRDDAAYSITPRQWERLAAAAMHYLSVYHTQNNFSDPAPQNTAPDMRFDVVLVDAAGRATWMENARRFDDW